MRDPFVIPWLESAAELVGWIVVSVVVALCQLVGILAGLAAIAAVSWFVPFLAIRLASVACSAIARRRSARK